MALHCPECTADNPIGIFYCERCGSPLLPEAMIPPAARRPAPAAPGEAEVEMASPPAQASLPGPAPPVAAASSPPPEPMPPPLAEVSPRPAAAAPPAPARASETRTFTQTSLRAQEATFEDTGRRYRIILGDTCPICRAASRITFNRDRPPSVPVVGCREAGGCRCALPIFADELEAALSAPQPSLEALAPARSTSATSQQAQQYQTTPPQVAAAPPPQSQQQAPPAPAPSPQISPAAQQAPDLDAPSPVLEQRQQALHDLTIAFYARRIQGVKIVTENDCCPICADVAASIYEPMAVPPIPIVGCWYGWRCRCAYGEEPLPLDEHSRQALARMQAEEKENELRRRGVALGGPRRLHQAAIAVAVVLMLGSLASWFDYRAIVLLLGFVCVLVGVASMRRVRRVPSPPWIYGICGLIVVLLALYPLAGVDLPPSVLSGQFDALGQTHFAPNLTVGGLQAFSDPQKAQGVLGLLLLVLGVVDLGLVSRSK